MLVIGLSVRFSLAPRNDQPERGGAGQNVPGLRGTVCRW